MKKRIQDQQFQIDLLKNQLEVIILQKGGGHTRARQNY